jgi:tripartite-type tricarboxylate transporter receptor subunit TctC
MRRRNFISATTATLLAGTGVMEAARAQDNLLPLARVLVGFPPGGSADVIGRALAERLRGVYAENVIVENRPGAWSIVVVRALMNGPADGTSMYLSNLSTSTLYPHVFRSLPFEPLVDLTPVSVVAAFEFALTIGSHIPATNLAEFVQWCKANPGKAAYGSLGEGSNAHFLGTMLSAAAGVEWNHVPFRGAGPGVQALLGGHVPSLIGPIGDIAPHHGGGKARVIAVSGRQRSRFLPTVPTFEESGFPGLYAIDGFGLYVKKGTPAPVIARLNKDVATALRQADFRTLLEKLSYEPRASTPQELQALIASEHNRWRDIVKASGFSVN